MENKLKHIELFENYNPESYLVYDSDFSETDLILFKTNLIECPIEFNNIKNEITGGIRVTNNKNLKFINNLSNINKSIVTFIAIGNPNLIGIVLPDNLKIKETIYIDNNPSLIYLSTPKSIISGCGKYTDFTFNEVMYDMNPNSLVNHYNLTRDLVEKFNPAIYPAIVVKQIIENLEAWGEPETIKTIINHILSKSNYLDLIPESMKQYVEEQYHYLYNAKHANTGARSIAKMTTGRYLGTF